MRENFIRSALCVLLSATAWSASAEVLSEAKTVSANSYGTKIPLGIFGASGNYGDSLRAIDGNAGTYWNSNGFSTQWIALDLGWERNFSLIRLLTVQSPAGDTNHRIWGRTNGGKMIFLGAITSYTSGGLWLEFQNRRPDPVRVVYVETISSPSWVAWADIEIYQ